MWLADAFELTGNQWRDHGAIVGQLTLPPANSQLAPKRFPIVEIGADHGSFQIKTLLHNFHISFGLKLSSFRAVTSSGSRRMTPRAKSNDTRKCRRKLPPNIPFWVKPAVSFTGSISSTAALICSRTSAPSITFGRSTMSTFSVTPAAPKTRILLGCKYEVIVSS